MELESLPEKPVCEPRQDKYSARNRQQNIHMLSDSNGKILLRLPEDIASVSQALSTEGCIHFFEVRTLLLCTPVSVEVFRTRILELDKCSISITADDGLKLNNINSLDFFDLHAPRLQLYQLSRHILGKISLTASGPKGIDKIGWVARPSIARMRVCAEPEECFISRFGNR